MKLQWEFACQRLLFLQPLRAAMEPRREGGLDRVSAEAPSRGGRVRRHTRARWLLPAAMTVRATAVFAIAV